jgi:dipeptidyl aminopeptidase/acylaminoacyl peptidase
MFLVVLILACFAGSVSAETLPITHWLVCGPVELAAPALSDSASRTSASELLKIVTLNADAMQPAEGASFTFGSNATVPWHAQTADTLALRVAKSPGMALAASYITTTRTQHVSLHVACDGALNVFVDGKRSDEPLRMEGQTRVWESSPLLHRGKHLLLVQTVANKALWKVQATVDADNASTLSVSTDQHHVPASFSDVTLFDNVSAPALSSDGKLLACLFSHRDADFKKETWIQIYDAQSANLKRELRPLKGPGNAQFVSNTQLLFTTSGENGSDVWLCNVVTGEMQPLARDIEGLQRIVMSPDMKTLYYTTDEEKKKSEEDPELWTALEDRMSDWTSTRRLFAYDIASQSTRALTALGEFAVDEFALSREGDKLLFTRRVTKVGRPYYTTEFWLYDVQAGTARLMLSQPLAFETKPASFCWLPGGQKIAYVTARFTTDPADTLHNMTQTDLFLLDVLTGKTIDLTPTSRFSVQESEDRSAISWNARAQKLWFQAVSGAEVKLMSINPLAAKPVAKDVGIALPFVADFNVSASGLCAFTGSAPSLPQALFTFSSSRRKLIVQPAEKTLQNILLADVQPWSFVNADKDTVEGRLFVPPDFSPHQKWPLIVYYYGGVSPRDDRFTFTYQWWCANGYVVYVLNPAGCIGYGQAFADKHSNDWGTRASRDIMDGTRELLKEKSFLDAQHVGCYGGSYGGFITLDIVTKTDLFASAISDAGISDITSYFGGGTWGFTYGDIALPGSFPWNRPDVFMGKSPVYHADRVRTPLLLIHGTADENVPALESSEMFTALKVQGKEVALIRFPGEDHSIATKFSNYVAYREMMLEWFDKYLKAESDGWNAQWKK